MFKHDKKIAESRKNTCFHAFKTIYTECIVNIVNLMRNTGLKHIDLPTEKNEIKSINVNVFTGDTDILAAVEYDGVNGSGLVAIGESGTIYPLGTSYDGQDNYQICEIEHLLTNVTDIIDGFVEKNLINDEDTKKHNIDAITKISIRNPIVFTRPQKIPGLDNIKEITGNSVLAEGKEEQLDKLQDYQIRYLVNIVNEHLVGQYNFSKS